MLAFVRCRCLHIIFQISIIQKNPPNKNGCSSELPSKLLCVDTKVLTNDDLIWPTASLQYKDPFYRCGAGSYPREVSVDPYPCYTHDQSLVEDLLAVCERAHPLPGAATQELCILSHEFVGRNNGFSWEDTIYRRPDETEWNEGIICYCGCAKIINFQGQAHTILLCGKRIPIMPSMTNYLVAHEYGHVAFNHRRRLLGYTASDADKMKVEYMRLRGVPDWVERPTARWHELAGEIIANDFRILMAKQETEFWPHNVPHPHSASGKRAILTWWTKTLEPAMVS